MDELTIHMILYTVFGILSLVVAVLFIFKFFCMQKNRKTVQRILSSVQILTVGVFLAVLLIFIPVYYIDYDFCGGYAIFRPLLIAIHNTLRVFILDGEFDTILGALKNLGEADILQACYGLYAAILYVLAPVLTFTNVLSLFKNLIGEARYHMHKSKAYYILSELNKRSIALAKSIHATKKNAVIVFADVFEQNEENDYEILTEARDMGAICLKKDIVHIDILRKKGNVELFLIGEDESENLSQAVRITNMLNRANSKQNVKIFVFSQNPSGTYILDSVRYDNLLQYASEHDYDDSCFKLRRINERQQFAWNTVSKMNLYEMAQRNGNQLSVLITGFGSYGAEFFKTLLWFCQFEGYQLQITIVDKRREGSQMGSVQSQIHRMCPALKESNRSTLNGEAYYDIEVIPGIDLTQADFDDLLFYTGSDSQMQAFSQRLKNTNMVLVGMGDDDLNIEVAVHLRSLFDRLNGVVATKNTTWEEEKVQIYSVVYDDEKSGILQHKADSEGSAFTLMNHKQIPYHIRFIGGMASQFDYQSLYDGAFEKKAYAHHISWVAIEERIYEEWVADGRPDVPNKGKWGFWDEKSQAAAKNAQMKYEKYEYYRLSSMARERYLQAIRNNSVLSQATTCLEGGKLQTCKCANCVRRKRSEHMRWNAYTRVMGYSNQGNIRADRALLHEKLVEWDRLTPLDKEKD